MRNDHESEAPITRIARNLKELVIFSYHIETLLVSMDFKLVLFGSALVQVEKYSLLKNLAPAFFLNLYRTI